MENNNTSYPLIIVGAGASFDSIDFSKNGFSDGKIGIFNEWKPPLTNEIFDTSRFDFDRSNLIEKYNVEKISRECSYKLDQTSGYNTSLESLVYYIRYNKAEKDKDWYNHLINFNFYISELFRRISKEYEPYHSMSNYGRLISQIEECSNYKACFVNFNYDLLLEQNIDNISETKNLDDYINGNIKVIKIHGACNWFRAAGRVHKDDGDFTEKGKEYATRYNNAENIIKKEKEESIDYGGKCHHIIKNREGVKNRIDENNSKREWNYLETDFSFMGGNTLLHYIPNIMMPINKKDRFVCPENHISELKNQLKIIDKIIIIGWKAGDNILLNILKEELDKNNKKDIPVIVVSPSGSLEVREKIRKHCCLNNIFSVSEGFSKFSLSLFGEILKTNNLDDLAKLLRSYK